MFIGAIIIMVQIFFRGRTPSFPMITLQLNPAIGLNGELFPCIGLTSNVITMALLLSSKPIKMSGTGSAINLAAANNNTTRLSRFNGS